MKKSAVLLVVLLGASAFAQYQGFGDLPKIAVYVTGNLGVDEKRALSTEVLTALVKGGRYKAVERSTAFMAEVDKEQAKQRSGAVDDSQIRALGKQFGVQYICIADVASAFGSYQMSTRIIDVETAEIGLIGKASGPLANMNDFVALSNEAVKSMFSTDAQSSTQSKVRDDVQRNERSIPYSTAAPRVLYLPKVNDFSGTHRFYTWYLNVIPGWGSAFVMNDYGGAAVQLGSCALGVIFLVNGFGEVIDTIYSGNNKEPRTEMNGLGYTGIGLLVGSAVWNIYRSSTYHRKPRKGAATFGNGLNLSVLPEQDGNVKGYLAYRMEF